MKNNTQQFHSINKTGVNKYKKHSWFFKIGLYKNQNTLTVKVNIKYVYIKLNAITI